MKMPMVVEAARSIRAGRLTSEALTLECIAAIERHNPVLNAFVYLDFDAALAEARSVDRIVKAGGALGPLAGGALIALGGPDLGWRLVFFVNVPVGIVVIMLARRFLPQTPATGKHRLDVLGSLILGAATFCVLFGAVEFEAIGRSLLFLAVPTVVLLFLFWRRERRLTDDLKDPLVDLRLFRRPSYVSGVTLALAFFPAIAGLPLVLALFYQRGLGYTALESALGVTAYAVGSAVSAPLAGRVVTRIGRKLVVAGAVTFGVGAIAMAVVAGHLPDGHATLALQTGHESCSPGSTERP